jgi:hypothetical protein
MATTDLPLPASEDTPAGEVITRASRDTIDATSANISLSAVGTANADSISAAASAIATANTSALETTACAVGLAQVDGDATVSLSAIPIMSAKGSVTFRQAYASAFISGSDVSISQGGAPLIIGREISIDTGGGCAIVASEATVRHGWIGLLLARNVEVADDTRVFLDTRGSLILAVALLGGFGIIAVAIYLSAKRLAQWRPHFPSLRR